MDGDRVGAGGGESLDPAGWLDDHEVDVDRELGCGADSLDDRETDADVGHEDAVHDVDVDEVGAGRFDAWTCSPSLRKSADKIDGPIVTRFSLT